MGIYYLPDRKVSRWVNFHVGHSSKGLRSQVLVKTAAFVKINKNCQFSVFSFSQAGEEFGGSIGE